MRPLVLRDKIPANPHTIFIGINPAEKSAQVGHYYAHPTNKFWALLHASGIWPEPIVASDDDEITKVGFGLTDVAKRPTPGVAHLSRSDFFQSRRRVVRIVNKYRPRTVVFVGLTAMRAYLGDSSRRLQVGLQDWKIGEADVFLLPSTSGASQGHTSYAEKLAAFRKLKEHLATYYPARHGGWRS